MEPRLLRTKEAAHYLAISAWKLRQLVHNARIPHIEIAEGEGGWRFDIADLDKFVNSRRVIGS